MYQVIKVKPKQKQYVVTIKSEKSEHEFQLSEELLLEYRLVNGKELDEPTYIAFQSDLAKDQLYQKVLHYALYKQRCTYDIIEYLKKKDVHPDTFKYYLNKLRNARILDDESYVSNYVNEAFDLKRHGPKKIRFDLERKHIKPEQIDNALADITHQKVMQNINILYRKKLQSIKSQSVTKSVNSIKQFISTKGYDYPLIDQVIQEHMDEIQERSNEQSAIKRELEKAMKKYKDDPKKNEKIIANLLRKGYRYHTIKAKMGE